MNEIFKKISDSLIKDGYIIIENALDNALVQGLYERIDYLKDLEFKDAKIGRGSQNQNNSQIRSDKTLWLEGEEKYEKEYLLWMNTLKQELNQALYIGLHDYETHFAYYPKGSFYKKHSDVLNGNNKRLLTSVFYLTKNWKDGDGGELVIYDKDAINIIKKVEPKIGTMIIFLSDKFPHEVLVSKKDRYSIAGWFKGRD